MRANWLVGLLAIGLVACPPVLAVGPTGEIVPPGYPSEPSLAGDETLWLGYGSGRGVELWSGAPGGASRRVQEFPFRPTRPATRDGFVGGALAASPSLGLVSTYGYEPDGLGEYEYTFSEHHVGPPTGPFEQIVRCATDPYTGLRAADVWGEAYAYRRCDEGDGHVEVRDTAAVPLSPSRSVGRGGYGARIAGRYVAWLDSDLWYRPSCSGGSELVVYDRVADAEVYRIPNAEMQGRVDSLDVQEDGTVVMAFEPGPCADLVVAWASPEEPYLHRLSLPTREHYEVQIGAGQIAFQRGNHVLDVSVPRAEVGIADLDGDVRVVARNTDAFDTLESFDFDGERLVWREFGCEERRLVIRRADEAGEARGGGTNCRARLLRKPVVRKGVATFHFGCGAFVTPCAFRVELRSARTGARVGRTPQSYRENPVRIKLRRSAWRALKRRGALRVNAKVELHDDSARVQVRRATYRLRAP